MIAGISSASVGRLTRICEIGKGGMGAIELALRREGSFRRLYAVKRLHPHLRDEGEVREMFLEEARLAGLLRHPNVVSVLDVGEDDDGPYLVMDYVEGVPLSSLIRHASSEGVPVPVQLVLRVALQVSQGLHAAHELRDDRGRHICLVHRDLSPQNILLSFDGAARLTDFGVAKALGRSLSTSQGVRKGKLGYMSPEQLRFQEVDRRSDLFSLGVIVAEMVTGSRLYGGEASETERARCILEEPPPDIGAEREDVPPELVKLCFELLAKSPEHRPPTADGVAQTLELILTQQVLVEGPVTLGPVLEALFGARREARRQLIAGAMQQAESPPEAAPASLPQDDAPTEVRPRPGRIRLLIAGLALTAVTVVAALAAVLLWPDPAPQHRRAGVRTPRELDSSVVSAGPDLAAPAPGIDRGNRDEAVEEPRARRPARRGPRRRRKAHRRRKKKKQNKAAPARVPVWEWK